MNNKDQPVIDRIYQLGMSTVAAVERGDRQRVLEIIKEARSLGVKIDDNAFDNIFPKITLRSDNNEPL